MKALMYVGGAVLLSVQLAACDKAATAHSLEYFIKNPTERAETLKKCKLDPDLTGIDENCRNAADAEFRSGSFKATPSKSW